MENQATGNVRKKVIILVSALLLVGIGVSIFLWYNNPERKMNRALDKGNLDDAKTILDGNRDLENDDEIRENLKQIIKQACEKYKAKQTTYSEALNELNSVRALQVHSLDEELFNATQFVEKLNQSRTYFDAAKVLQEKKDYPKAIVQYQLVSSEDPDYALAMEQLKICEDSYREDSLKAAEDKAKAEDYQGAIDILEMALKTLQNDSEVSGQIVIYRADLETQQKNDLIAAAEGFAEKEQFTAGIQLLDQYLQKNGIDADIKAARQHICDQYAESIIAKADGFLKNETYPTAIVVLESGLRDLPDNTQILIKLAEVNEAYVQQFLKDAKEKYESGNIDEAIDILEKGLKKYNDDTRLAAELQEYNEQNIKTLLAEADRLILERDYDNASMTVQEALKKYADEPRLVEKNEEIENRRPRSFNYFATLNGGFVWNSPAAVDPAGNDYSGNGDYIVYDAYRKSNNSSDNTQYINGVKPGTYLYAIGHYEEIKISEKYKSFTGTLIPYESMGQDGWGYIKVYADSKLVYTSPNITQKTKPVDFSIDVSGVDYLAVYIITTKWDRIDNGAIILSNPLLLTE